MNDNGPRVPRDEAFWNTYYDVNAEMAAIQKRIECDRYGHVYTDDCIIGGSTGIYCKTCGMTEDQLAAQGFIKRIQDGNRTCIEFLKW